MADVGAFRFAAVAESLSAARACVRGVLNSHGHGDKEMDVNIVVGEILQNIIRYGFDGGDASGEFEIQFQFSDRMLEVMVSDNAPPSDSRNWNNAHRKPEEGGHGLTLVNAIAQSVDFEMLEAGNRATLRFAL